MIMVGDGVKLINADSERRVFLRRWGEKKILATHTIGGGTKGARGAMAPPHFIQLVMVFKHIPTLVTYGCKFNMACKLFNKFI